MTSKKSKDKSLEKINSLNHNDSALAPNDPVGAYMAEIKKYPLLSIEEERELAEYYYESKDSKAAQKLITSNLRFVVKIAAEYTKFGSKLIDLIQEGNVGLMHAVKEFNPHKDVRLISYAVWWIRGYIQEYLMKQHSIVKIGTTTNQKKLFYKLNKEKEAMRREGLEPSVKLLSSRLGVREKDVKLMENRLGSNDLSLDQPMGENNENRLLDLQKDEYHEVMDEKINFKENLENLSETLIALEPSLSEKEKTILKERILADPPKTLQELGTEWGVTREAVRQAEARLLKKIKNEFQS